jgi:hypothetical protein
MACQLLHTMLLMIGTGFYMLLIEITMSYGHYQQLVLSHVKMEVIVLDLTNVDVNRGGEGLIVPYHYV